MKRSFNIFIHTQALNFANSIHSNLKSSLTQEIDANVSLLDRLVHRTTQDFEIDIYRKPTSTDTVINFTSNHPKNKKKQQQSDVS